MGLEREWGGGPDRDTALVMSIDPRERGTLVAALRGVRLLRASRGREEPAREPLRVATARDPYEALLLFARQPAVLVVFSVAQVGRREASCLRQMRHVSPAVRVLLVVPEGRRAEVGPFLREADSLLTSPFYPDEVRLLARSLLRTDGIDPLTGLSNRAAGDLALHRETARLGGAPPSRADRRAPRTGEAATVACALLDIDRFKRVNTRFGLLGGDDVLREVGRRLRQAFRLTDTVSRRGGEEFLVVMNSLPSDPEEARRIACSKLNGVREAIRASSIRIRSGKAGGADLTVTLSGGLALCPHEGVLPHDLLAEADGRLARAKRVEGRNCIVCGDATCPH